MTETHDIQLHGLSTGYRTGHGTWRIVGEGLEATARHGKLTCVIGRNGTGKSTLLRTVARLQPSAGGHVTAGGRPTATMTATEMAREMSVVLTTRPTAQLITVEETVALGRAPYTGFWGRLTREDRIITRQAMHSMGISHMAGRTLSSLSDGELQKTMIAKALAQRTPCILLDEPTAFLDFTGKIDLMMTMRQLAHDAGKTILMSTHDLETALRMADCIWLLDNSGIVSGTPASMASQGLIDRYIGKDFITVDCDSLAISIGQP